MAKKFYISPEIDYNNELRVTYGKLDGFKDYIFEGIKSDSRLLMDRLYGEDYLDMSTLSFLEIYELQSRNLIKKQSNIFSELEKRGYDKDTLIFSIKKEPDKNPTKKDIQNKLNNIKVTLMNVIEQIDDIEETKGVFLMSDQEKNNIIFSLQDILNTLD